MQLLDTDKLLPAEQVHEQIAMTLKQRGWCYLPNALPRQLCAGLLQQLHQMGEQDFEPAGVGRQALHKLNEFVRRDRIRWIDGHSEQEREWLQWMEALRLSLNRHLFLGLFSFESHFARYSAGAFYRRHLDAFKGEANRMLSTVLYLNPDWTTQDGGALVLYEPQQDGINAGNEIGRFMPAFGSLAVFLSEEFPHEVLPTARERLSIAGWFRINSSTADRVDPAH